MSLHDPGDLNPERLGELIALTKRFALPLETVLVVKDAAETVNNSSTLQDDDDLQLPVGPQQLWVVRMGLIYDSGTTPDFKWAFSLPSGTMSGPVHSLILTAAAVTDDRINAVDWTTGLTGGGLGVGTDAAIAGEAVLRTLGAGGTAKLQWAQNTANASDTRLEADSYLWAQRFR